MTYREFINIIGHTLFHKMSKGIWYEEYILSKGLDLEIDRYCLWAYKPFYIVNEAYIKAYEKNIDIGSLDNWLNGHPTKEEIEEWKNGNV